MGTMYADKSRFIKWLLSCYTEGRKIAEAINDNGIITSIYANASLTHAALNDFPKCQALYVRMSYYFQKNESH